MNVCHCRAAENGIAEIYAVDARITGFAKV